MPSPEVYEMHCNLASDLWEVAPFCWCHLIKIHTSEWIILLAMEALGTRGDYSVLRYDGSLRHSIKNVLYHWGWYFCVNGILSGCMLEVTERPPPCAGRVLQMSSQSTHLDQFWTAPKPNERTFYEVWDIFFNCCFSLGRMRARVRPSEVQPLISCQHSLLRR